MHFLTERACSTHAHIAFWIKSKMPQLTSPQKAMIVRLYHEKKSKSDTWRAVNKAWPAANISKPTINRWHVRVKTDFAKNCSMKRKVKRALLHVSSVAKSE